MKTSESVNPELILRECNPKIYKRFIAYHLKHPEVWELFKQYSEEMFNASKKRYSGWAIMNRIRWDHDIKKTEQFKISNCYIALYSRLLMAAFPKFVGFFRLRPLKGEKNFRSSSFAPAPR